MSGKQAFLNRLETACNIPWEQQFKKGTGYSIYIIFLIFQHGQSFYPSVLQDVIAENKCLKEIVSKIDF